MTNDWDFFPLRVDDQPASIFVDLGIRSQAPIKSHPTMAYLRVPMRRPRADGLSSQEEFEDLVSLEDAITAELNRDGATLFVGRNTSGGNRDFYFYTSDPEDFKARIQEVMGRHSLYAYETGQREDQDWRTYLDFLHPSEGSMQVILNRRVCQQLEKSGDNLNKDRKIDHFALFPSVALQSTFAQYLSEEGFVIDNAPKTTNAEGRFYIEFSRNDVPAKIDDIVLPLFAEAKAIGGDYDGWGCEIKP